jgi:hypothetical protein
VRSECTIERSLQDLMPVVLVTIDSDWIAPPATPRIACSAVDGERAVSLSKQVL